MICHEGLELLHCLRAILHANEILSKIQSSVSLNSMLNVTGSKQLDTKDEEGHHGVIDKGRHQE